MSVDEELEKLKRQYLAFAEYEAEGRCEEYFNLANWVAESEAALRFVAGFKAEKRQPNLVFASIRKVYGVPLSLIELEQVIRERGSEIAAVVRAKRTQTNEPARCSAMLLALSRLENKSISLIEAGASAGLCMIPDYYRYLFGDIEVIPKAASATAPQIQCGFSGAMPKVNEDLNIVWRCGIDLNPINLSDEEEGEWLETMVWPGQSNRLQRLRGAIGEARKHELIIRQGHLLDHLETTVSSAPKGSAIVVYHSAVMNYMRREDVIRFRELIGKLPANWIFQEDIRIFPDLIDADRDIPKGRFGLVLNGNILAHTHPHGEDIFWF